MKLKNVLKSPWTAVHGSFAFELYELKTQTHPAQWVGLKALRKGLGVGGEK
jgi:hypothetical protein